MEQAVNTFQKGLNTDSHPMAQGNDSLTDALNATFVTMNGNEIILQNDMGNRRIDNAFLPSGYQPVGMKEYGGIIYVAAYNPITNKSQIGSFPSPERKLGIENGLGIQNDRSIRSYFESYSKEGLNFLKSDTILLPLTDRGADSIPLHPGDKFTVYGKDLNSGNNISNYNNTEEDKVRSPKNKQYTLSLGILNSQNEFVDITPSLARWDNSNNIHTFTNESELYKFNYGYFIPNMLMPDTSNTIDDNDFRKSRESIAANTYSYKLVGPLYLKMFLNHITRFNYNIYGKKSSDTVAEYITIEAEITYNCPDGVLNSKSLEENDIYKTLDEGLDLKVFNAFDLYINRNGTYSKLPPSLSGLNEEVNIKEPCKYNPETNDYTVTITKTYRNVNATSGTNLEYYLCVSAVNNENLYLESLSQKGVLDISLLNTGTIKLDGWRFFNGDEQTELTYIFETYPKENEEFINLVVKLTPYLYEPQQNRVVLDDSNAIAYILDNISNGRNTVTINWTQAYKAADPSSPEGDWDDPINPWIRPYSNLYYVNSSASLEKRKLYYAELYFRRVVNGQQRVDYEKIETDDTLWLLTTDLLNQCYLYNSDSFASNYCEKENGEYVNESIKYLMTIQPLSYYNISEDGTCTIDKEGNLVYPISYSGEGYFRYKYTYNGKLKCDPVLDNELYPDCVKVSRTPTPHIEKYNSSDDIQVNGLTYTYVWKDEIKSSQYESSGTINGLYKTISSVIQNSNKLNSFTNFQVGPAVHPEGGHRDYHTLAIRNFPIKNAQNNKNIWMQLEANKSDGAVIYNFSKYKDEILDYIPSHALFAFGFGHPKFIADDGEDYERKIYIKNSLFTNEYGAATDSTENKSRLWWRTYDGSYALYEDLVEAEGTSGSNGNLENPNIDNTLNFILQSSGFGNLAYRIKESEAFSDAGIKTLDVNKIAIPNKHDDQFLLKLCISESEENNFVVVYPQNIFKVNTKIENQYYNTPIFESSDEFFDTIESFDPKNIENIFVNGSVILLQDYSLNLLDNRLVYLFHDNKELIEVKDFVCSTEITLDSDGNFFAPVYYGTSLKSPKYKYDNAQTDDRDSEDQKTALQYDRVLIVPTFDKLNFKSKTTTTEQSFYGNSYGNFGGSSSNSNSSGGTSGSGTGFGGRVKPSKRDNEEAQDIDLNI